MSELAHGAAGNRVPQSNSPVVAGSRDLLLVAAAPPHDVIDLQHCHKSRWRARSLIIKAHFAFVALQHGGLSGVKTSPKVHVAVGAGCSDDGSVEQGDRDAV